MDIIICKLKYPNDPTNTLKPHQNFVGFYSKNEIVLYTISSILGKESRVYDTYNNVKEEYYLLEKNEQLSCSLKVPSFIDCTKCYKIIISSNIKIQNLSYRNIPIEIKNKILNKITQLKSKNKNKDYIISESDFIKYNPKVI